MRLLRTTAFCFLIAAAPLLASSQDKKKSSAQLAPVPTALLKAKKIFLVNTGSDASLFDLFYSEMKSWGKYELVGSPEEADLTFEFSFGSQGEAPEIYTNAGTGMTYSIVINKAKMAVRDTRSKSLLWSSTQTAQGARRKKTEINNQRKAVLKLLDDFKRRVTPESLQTEKSNP